MATAAEKPRPKARSKLRSGAAQRRRSSRTPDPTTKYARAVVRGAVVACRYVREACQRHLDDLERSDLRFDRRRAWRAITYFRTLRHVKNWWGGRAGEHITLQPPQEFIVGSLMGWVRHDGRRRFRDGYIEIARKNAKSTLVAGLISLLTFFDGEGGAEGYVAATKKDQARIIFGDAKLMMRRVPAYRRRLRILEHTISDPESGSRLVALGADADTMDGLNPHAVALDELHAHPTPKVLEVMESAVGARSQPMILKTTTAGWNRNSVCWRERERALRVLDPASDVEDDGLFAFVATLDQGDDYRDEKVWVKANPLLGVSVDIDELRRAVRKATDTPEELPNLLQKRFNVWVSNSIDRPFEMELFDAGADAIDVALLRGRPCFGGLDLARVRDLSSFALVFPPLDQGERWKYLGWHFIPADNVQQRTARDGAPYARWLAQEKVMGTPGDTTDLTAVRDKILEVAKLYEIREVAYDPTFAADIARDLTAAGVTVLEHFQKYSAMSLPSAELLRLITAKQLQHGGDPVLRWCADNLVLRSGPAGRLMPDKERSREKIDAMVALIMAVGRAAVAAPPEVNPYNERGIRRLGE